MSESGEMQDSNNSPSQQTATRSATFKDITTQNAAVPDKNEARPVLTSLPNFLGEIDTGGMAAVARAAFERRSAEIEAGPHEVLLTPAI